MNSRTSLLAVAATLLLNCAIHAAPLHSTCFITSGDEPGKLQLRIREQGCDGDRNCGSTFSNDSMSRFTGIGPADLSREGAQLTATLNADAGVFTCAGTVHDGELKGESAFTPSQAFVDRMSRMGITGLDAEKLQAYALLDVESAWAQSLMDAHVRGIDADNLIALRIFHIDPAYVAGFNSMGYGIPDAGQLISLKVQGVNTDEVREIRNLGFKPSLDDLIQIRIFHITPDFIRSMQARGFKDLTIAKLVQIKIFKLDE